MSEMCTRTIGGDTIAKRPGQKDVYMHDPKMSFQCGPRIIEVKRYSGGVVMINMLVTKDGPIPHFRKAIEITKERFHKLWDVLDEMTPAI